MNTGIGGLNESVALELEALSSFIPSLVYEFDEQAKALVLHLVPHGDQPARNVVSASWRITQMERYPAEPFVWDVEKSVNLDTQRLKGFKRIVEDHVSQACGSELIMDTVIDLVEFLKTNNTPIQSVWAQMNQPEAGDSDGEESDFGGGKDNPYAEFLMDPEIEQYLAEERNKRGFTNDNKTSSGAHEEFQQSRTKLADKDLCEIVDRITEEQFLSWRETFKVRMIADGLWADVNLDDGRLTGRQLFLTGQIKEQPVV